MLYDANGFSLALGPTDEPVRVPGFLHFGVHLPSPRVRPRLPPTGSSPTASRSSSSGTSPTTSASSAEIRTATSSRPPGSRTGPSGRARCTASRRAPPGARRRACRARPRRRTRRQRHGASRGRRPRPLHMRRLDDPRRGLAIALDPLRARRVRLRSRARDDHEVGRNVDADVLEHAAHLAGRVGGEPLVDHVERLDSFASNQRDHARVLHSIRCTRPLMPACVVPGSAGRRPAARPLAARHRLPPRHGLGDGVLARHPDECAAPGTRPRSPRGRSRRQDPRRRRRW